VALAAVSLLAAATAVRAGDEERKLEAVFLGRFASYIAWPAGSRERVVITLIDENPFGSLLDHLYQGRRIHDKPVELRYVTRVDQIGASDILFITLDTVESRQAAIDHAQKHGILTISEARGFAERGGIIQINFVQQQPRIKINYEAAVKSGIKIGAPLLSIAEVVRGGGK
jgi:hypothetical protein